MKLARRWSMALCGAFSLLAACSGDPAGPADPVAEARAQIYTRINQLRATEAKAAFSVWTAGEACATDQAESDSEANNPHAAFGQCGESGQNECVSYPSLSQLSTDCLQQMWDEGPGDIADHGHYLNLSSTTFTRVAVGIYVTPANTVWAVMNFAP